MEINMQMLAVALISVMVGYFIGFKVCSKNRQEKTIEVKVPVPTPIELPNNIILWIEVDK